MEILHRGLNQRARYHPGTARQCFVFNPALVSANRDFFRATFLQKIHVCTFRRKHVMLPDLFSSAANIDNINPRNMDDYMRHASVDVMNRSEERRVGKE